VGKLLFIPFSVLGGLAAGFVGKKVFEQVWSLIDDEDPPDPSERRAHPGKIVAAAALQGAVFSATRAATDRGSRQAFLGLTGSWPGETDETA
jgi:Protein of unknown function (DUF4235)